MKPRKHGKKWEIQYRCPGFDKPFHESYNSVEEAELRIAQIMLERKLGVFIPPAPESPPEDDPESELKAFQESVTIAQLMEEFINVYGKTQWAGNTAKNYRARISYYITPRIGDVKLKKVNGHFLTKYYTDLLGSETIPKRGQKPHQVSACVVGEIHKILRSAFNQAIKWDWMVGTNPADKATLPRYKRKPRQVLTEKELHMALQSCRDPILNLCINLSLGCSMRIGEILGLTWDDIHIEPELIESGDAYLHIGKQLQRLRKEDIENMILQDPDSVQYIFPDLATHSQTSLVLSKPKTETSTRDNYIPRTIAKMLVEHRLSQQETKREMYTEYQDFNLVIAQNNGRPYERDQIHKLLRELEENAGLPQVVFHSFRHSSTSMKLKIGGGDIKSVQGDTGHAQATMVTEVYSHIATEDRKRLAIGIDPFFADIHHEENVPEVLDSNTTKLLTMISSDPEKAEKLVKLMELLG